MATTTEYGFTLPTVGGSTNSWGTNLNANWTKIDGVLGDTTTVTDTGSTYTLSTAEEDAIHINCTGTLIANLILTFTGRGGIWTVANNCTLGAYSLTATISGGTAVTIPAGHKRVIYCNTTTNEIELIEDNAATVAEVEIASGSTTDIFGAASPYISVTGTTGITSFGTGANLIRYVRFASALTITHHATTLICPYAEDLVIAAGDVIIVQSASDSDARIINITHNDETDFAQHHELEIGVDTQAWDAGLDQVAAAASTRGNLIQANSSANWSALPIGTANQVLLSDGTDLTWSSNCLASATATAGNMLLGDGTDFQTELAIGAANKQLTSNGTTASWTAQPAVLYQKTMSDENFYTDALEIANFTYYEVIFKNIVMSADGDDLWLRMAVSGANSALTYKYGTNEQTDVTSNDWQDSNNDITTAMVLATTLGNSTNEQAHGKIEVWNLGVTGFTSVHSNFVFSGIAAAQVKYEMGAGEHQTATSYNQLYFAGSTDTIASGTMTIIGYP